MQYLLSRKYFKLYFIFYVFLNTLNLKFLGIERNPLYLIVFLWGIFILGHDIANNRLYYQSTHLRLLCVFGFILFVATSINVAYSNFDSYIIWGMQMFIFLLIFANPKGTTLRNIKEELQIIIPFTSILTLLATGISVFMFFFNITVMNHGVSIGLINQRLFGIYFNCNPAAFLACIMLVFSFIAIKSNYQYRALYYVNFYFQLLYIILSGCRTALMIVIFIFLAFLYDKLFTKYGYSKIKQIIISMFVSVMVILGSTCLQKTLYIIPQLQGAKEVTTSRFQFDKIVEIIALLQAGKTANFHKIYYLADDVSSGRLELLNTAYQIFHDYPILGVGVNNFQKIGIILNPKDQVIKQPQIVHTHNVFIETAVVGGVFGFIVFFLFFLKSVKMIRYVYRKYLGSNASFIILCFILVVLCDFIGGMFDYGVFYVYSLSTTLAWMSLGYLYSLQDYFRNNT